MTMIEKFENNDLYFQFKMFNDIKFVNHLFTSRIGWSSDIRKRISNIFGIPEENVINVKQVHGTDIQVIDSNINDYKNFANIEADGLITNLPQVALTTYHADCVPIYFIDISHKVVGLAHGGWRGTFENISGKMVDTLREIYNSNNEDILVGIGPSIGPCCYEVGEDLKELFSNRYINFKDIIVEKNGRIFLDLWKVNFLQLIGKGIPEENIAVSNMCTSCNIDKFFSYRKENGTKHRMIAAICLK